MTTFLDRDEISRLTGAHRRHTQIRVLKANRLPFFLNAAGWPVVLRSAVEGSTRHEQAKAAPKKWSSNAA